MPTAVHDGIQGRWRTPTAIGLAVAFGALAGFFSDAALRPPFGPVILGLLVLFGGAVIVTGVLCILATRWYAGIGFAYAAGAAGAFVMSTVAMHGLDEPWWSLLVQFVYLFGLVGLTSRLGSGLCALLKWEDKKARMRNG